MKKQLIQKISELTKENRNYKQRFLLSIICNILFSFTFIVFGPYELYYSNTTSFDSVFSFGELWWIMAIIGVCYVLFLSPTIALLKGKIYDYVMSIFFWCSICGYLQGNFLNGKMNILDGLNVAWNEMSQKTLLNLIVWFVLLILIFLVLYMSRTWWRNVIISLSGMVVFMQVVALVFMIITIPTSQNNDKYLSTENIYELSEKDNIIIFVLDRFDKKVYDDIEKKEASFFERFGGFTSYENVTSLYSYTFPAIPYLLTGQGFLLEQWYTEYENEAYANSEYLKELQFADYEVEAYTNASLISSTASNVISNLRIEKKDVSHLGIAKGMLNLSAYRYAPMVLKPTFWCYTGDLQNMALENEKTAAYSLADDTFHRNLIQTGLHLQNEHNNYKFYHLVGAHPPYTLDEYGYSTGVTTQQTEQAKGSIRIVCDYLDQMKKLGIYKNATIIITADHGYDDKPSDGYLGEPNTPIFFFKAAGVDESMPYRVDNTPISQADIFATILSIIGSDVQIPVDKTLTESNVIFDIPEDSDRIRNFYNVRNYDGNSFYSLLEYNVQYDANDFNNWKYSGTEYLNNGEYY